MKNELLSALIAFILSIVALAGLNRLQVTDIPIDSNTSMIVVVAALIAVFTIGYINKKL